MKYKLLVMLAMTMLAGPLYAADPQPDQAQLEKAEQRLKEAEAERSLKEAKAEKSLEEARRKLEEAAREVAELSMEASGDMEIIRHMRSNGRRAMLGINIGPGEGAAGKGVKVVGVTPGGPADQAGLMAGDVITSVGGTSLAADSAEESNRLLVKFMRKAEPGEDIKLVYERDGKSRDATVRSKASDAMAFGFVAPRAGRNIWIDGADAPNVNVEVFEDGMPHRRWDVEFFRSWAGMELVNLTKELGDYFGTDEGLLVVRGPGQEGMDIRDGDVIKQIDGRTPESPSHAMRILRSYQPGEKVTVQLIRKKKKTKVEITLPERKVSKINQILELELEDLHELDQLDSLHEMFAPPAPPAPREPPAKT